MGKKERDELAAKKSELKREVTPGGAEEHTKFKVGGTAKAAVSGMNETDKSAIAKDKKKDEKKAAGKKRKDARKAQLKLVLDFVKENTKIPELLEAVKALTPGFRSTVRTAGKRVIADLFCKQATVNENQLFDEFYLGRGEMSKIIRNLIKKAEKPEARMWIKFDPTSRVYTLLHVGKDAPEGWTGYLPITIADMEIKDLDK